MLYILNTKLNKDKRALYNLKQILGINYSYSLYLCKKIGLNKKSKISEIISFRNFILLKLIKKESIVTFSLERTVNENIKNKINIRSYQGIRHRQKLPVRGQNTKNNAKTNKKKR